METREPVRRADAVETLVGDVKTEVDLFLQTPHTFQVPGGQIRLVDLDPGALSILRSLPINYSQITDVQMLVRTTDEETTLLKVEQGGKTTDTFPITKPQTTSIYLNFKDSKKPYVTFLYTLDLQDGQLPRGAYISSINPQVNKLDVAKPSMRANIASELNSIKQLLKSQNGNGKPDSSN